MAFNSKRKFDDAEELARETYISVKHTKVAPIAEPMVTEDVDMAGDNAPSPAPSLASLATTASSHNSREFHFDADMMDSDPGFDPRKQASNRSDSTVGLMQPQTIARSFLASIGDHVLTLLDCPWTLLLLAPIARRSPASVWPRILVSMGAAASGVIVLNVSRITVSAVPKTPKTTNNTDPTSAVSTDDLLSDNCLVSRRVGVGFVGSSMFSSPAVRVGPKTIVREPIGKPFKRKGRPEPIVRLGTAASSYFLQHASRADLIQYPASACASEVRPFLS
ncbi:hypothetical protein AG1IA_00869 [Rhizoctonia solani AG-1 IA]|uniref:Uncharacterized protein n=1 Tax=Thanatephorus cucumeris (strain AG1-IA) TaxID=983506 RepID=L8X7Q1_THACA|nr:hypothetical protein AG1IA_00869 [Rhizoctonia solani AG-1 IA]